VEEDTRENVYREREREKHTLNHDIRHLQNFNLKRTNEKHTDRSTGVGRRQREKMERETMGGGINADVQMLRVLLWMEKILSRLSGIGQSER
jgi:hypothetical protein